MAVAAPLERKREREKKKSDKVQFVLQWNKLKMCVFVCRLDIGLNVVAIKLMSNPFY